MPTLDNHKIRSKLSRKFHFANEGGTRHDRYMLTIGDEVVAWVDVERHKDAARDTLIRSMASQLGVKPREFREMVQCTKSEEWFLQVKGITVIDAEATADSELPPEKLALQKVPPILVAENPPRSDNKRRSGKKSKQRRPPELPAPPP